MAQMSENQSMEDMLEEQLGRLRKEEAQKQILYDRTIGGDSAPRPSVQFIQDCVGPPKSEAELQVEARSEVERMRQLMIDDAMQQAQNEQSMREHTTRLEEMQSLDAAIERAEESSTLRDAFAQANQTERDDLYEQLADREHMQRQSSQELDTEHHQGRDIADDYGPEE